MLPKRLVALLLAGAVACERTPKGEHDGEDVATLATSGEDRSLENDGCAIDFAYREPYYVRDDGFRPLPRVRDGTPSEIALEATSTAPGVPSVAMDESGRVFRVSHYDGGPTKYLFAGQVEEHVLVRVLASRSPAARSELRDFTPPHRCYDTTGGVQIRVYGIAPSLRSPVLLASAGGYSASRRSSKHADALIRWTLTIRSRVLALPSYCDTQPQAPGCAP